jgi:hypothetical protein
MSVITRRDGDDIEARANHGSRSAQREITMADSTFVAPLATPFCKDHVLYHAIESAGVPSVRAWQFSGWKAESMS